MKPEAHTLGVPNSAYRDPNVNKFCAKSSIMYQAKIVCGILTQEGLAYTSDGRVPISKICKPGSPYTHVQDMQAMQGLATTKGRILCKDVTTVGLGAC